MFELLLEDFQSLADLGNPLLWQRVDHLENGGKIFEVLVDAENDSELSKQADGGVLDGGLRVF
jgi:hypothetical protein